MGRRWREEEEQVYIFSEVEITSTHIQPSKSIKG